MDLQACGAKYHFEDFLDQTDVDDVVVALVNMAKRVYLSTILMIFSLFNMLFSVISICIKLELSGQCYYLVSVQYALNRNYMHRHVILILPNILWTLG